MFFTFITSYILLFLTYRVTGHIALWDDSMFGRCGDNNQCINTNQPVVALSNLKFNDWWWHHYLDFPPVNDTVMALPAGKSLTVQLAGNVAFTSLGQHPEAFWPGGAGNTLDETIVDPNFWNDGPSGAGSYGHADVAGCALSIAYTDDPRVVRPEDMVIFSVQQDCVWHRDTVFDIPANMPPCPNGKCMCSWWWIHNSDGGSDEMYQTAFQCNITYEPGQRISTTPVGKPVPPTNCENNKSKCVKGPKLPMYWHQLECNNMPEPGHFASTYNDRYGFYQGAQDDIFETINTSNWTCPQSKAPGVFATQSRPQSEGGSIIPQPVKTTQIPRPSSSAPIPIASSISPVPSSPTNVPSVPSSSSSHRGQCKIHRQRSKRAHSF